MEEEVQTKAFFAGHFSSSVGVSLGSKFPLAHTVCLRCLVWREVFEALWFCESSFVRQSLLGLKVRDRERPTTECLRTLERKVSPMGHVTRAEVRFPSELDLLRTLLASQSSGITLVLPPQLILRLDRESFDEPGSAFVVKE